MADINDTANVTLKINSQEAIDKFDQLEKKAKQLRSDFADAFKKGDTTQIKNINKELVSTNKSLDLMRTRSSNINAAMKSLSVATPKELQRTIKLINAELNSGEIPRGSAKWKEYQNQLKLVRREMNKIQKESAEVQTGFQRFNSGLSKWGGTITAVIAGFTGVSLAISSMKKDAREKESSQASLKALTGLDDANVQWLTTQAELLSTTMDESGLRVTQSSKEILDAYMMVGSNKPELLADKEALNAVTIETMRLASASGMELKDAVEAVTTSLNQYGAGADDAAKYVNILAAGSKFGSSNVEQQSASILRSGTAAASANVSMEQLVGSIQMLGEKGIKGEIAGTGLKKFFLTLQTGAKETNPKVVGLSQAMQNLKMQVDKAEQSTPGGGAGLLKKMFGEEGYNTASILTSNISKMEEYTEAVTGSSTAIEQAAINSETSEAKLAQMKNQIRETGIELMNRLNPSFGVLVNWSTKLIKIMPSVLDFLAKNKITLMSLVTAIIAYNIYVSKKNILDKLQVFWNEKIIASFKKLWATIAANPGVALAAVIGIVIAKLVDMSRATADLNAAVRVLNEIKNEAQKSMVEEKNKIDLLVDAANNEKLSLDDRKLAIDKLNRIIPNYNAELDETTGKYKENKMALDKYLIALDKKYRLEGAKSKLAELGKQEVDLSVKKAEIEKQAEQAKKNLREAYRNGGGQGWNYSIRDQIALPNLEAELKTIQDKIQAIKDVYQEDFVDDMNEGLKTEAERIKREAEEAERASKEVDSTQKKVEQAKKELQSELAKIDGFEKLADVENTTQYTIGAKTYSEYIAKKYKIDLEYVQKRKQIYEDRDLTGSAEYQSLLIKEAELKKQQQTEITNITIEELSRRQEREEDAIISTFYNSNHEFYLNEKLRNEMLHGINITYLTKKRNLYVKNSKEWVEYQAKIDDAEGAEKLRKQKEYSDAIEKWREAYTKRSNEERKVDELKLLEETHKQGLISEEEYQKLRYAILKKYAEMETGTSISDPFVGSMIQIKTGIDLIKTGTGSLTENLNSIASIGSAAFSIIGGAMQQYSQYSQACMELEVAQTEKKYEKLIAAAGNNDAKKKKLEAQKEKEITKIKKRANDDAMKMEIAQAIASTALSAINAYNSALQVGGPFGLVLAPIAAGMALAAGALQIATIKKQHQAQAVGYYSGGFTPTDANQRKEVGAVHANEFVANHYAVANPNIRPVLSIIDAAQRNNTIGSLTAQDVSNALGQGAILGNSFPQPSQSAQPTNEQSQTIIKVVDNNVKIVEKLMKKLDEGIESYMVMDGERGFDQKYEHYKKLKTNPKK